MIVHPEELADKGCWVSDDRVYLFVSSNANGITEIGYHGAQPASRNVRIFVNEPGVLRFAVASREGDMHQLALSRFEWTPGSVMMRGSSPIGSATLVITASGRTVKVAANEFAGQVSSFLVQLHKASLFTDVHGRRTWDTGLRRDGWVTFQVRDQILLDEWMKREGAYGADFLIPEPIRRQIYRRRIRSGLASPADLLPEFQNNPLEVYRSVVRIDVGGEGYCVSEDGDVLLFTAPIAGSTKTAPEFMTKFDNAEDVHFPGVHHEEAQVSDRVRDGKRTSVVPTISLPGFRRTEQFFESVPGLVESCVIRDYGVPRATPGGYYWIWAWDAMVTALVGLRWGETDIAARTAAFVDGHRDEECIPMRWTHSLEPLDTQPPGALETLFSTLAYAVTRERTGSVVSRETYARMVRHLNTIASQIDRRGLFSNIGFYPDLPVRFGRTEQSTVALESAAFYSFCRVCENCALQMEDEPTVTAVRKIMGELERSFSDVFWDKRRKFFIDAVERKSGLRNTSYPLFTLLFLTYPPALRLVRDYVTQSADFIGKHLLTPLGMRMLPTWDRNNGSETVAGSWYPHWDSYAMKLLRRESCSKEIMRWLRSVELTLEHLGYAPEFLVLDPSLLHDPSAWIQHGSASNLNCATGWYQALLEGVLGLEFDPGGLTIIPLGLPLGEAGIRDVCHLGTRWSVKTSHAGSWLRELRVDGQVQHGCMKIPMFLHDAGHHEVELLYGESEPAPHFAELANAEVLNVATAASGVEIALNALGQVDLVYSAPPTWELTVDGKRFRTVSAEPSGRCSVSLPIFGEHTVRISRRV
jgi:hypothetical protein